MLLLALAAALPCHAQPAADFRADAVPVYVWGLVALLALVWLKVVLPDRKRGPAPAAARSRSAVAAPTAAQPRSAVAAPAAAPTRPAAWTLEAIRGLDGRRFENFIQGLWQVNGYRADLSGKSADGGAEITIHSAANGRLFAVAQCRPARSGLLGADSIGGLYNAVQQQSATMGIFYGLAGFAPEALAFAQGKRVKLVSANELLTQVSALRPEQQKVLLEHVWRRG